MSKSLVISDLHGRDFRSIYEYQTSINTDLDKIILLGDYFDDEQRWENNQTNLFLKRFEDIFSIKNQDSRIEVLLGNHESAYLSSNNFNYESKNRYAKEVKQLVEVFINQINIAYQGPKFIYSHQGLTKNFMREINCNTLMDLNNRLHRKDYSIFDVKDGLNYSWNVWGSNYNQLNEIYNNPWYPYQIIGHFSGTGIRIKNGIIVLEDYKHSNTLIIEE